MKEDQAAEFIRAFIPRDLKGADGPLPTPLLTTPLGSHKNS